MRGVYDPKKAQHKAVVRIHAARWQFSAIEHTPALRAYIIKGLKGKLSPEAISGRMRQEGKPWYASKTAIYDWLYSAHGQKWCRYLLSHRYNRRRRHKKKGKKTLIPERVSIHDRPPLTDTDFEGDTIVSSWNTVSIVTLYSPLLMYLAARKVPNLKPETIARAFASMLKAIEVSSLTFDNGQENRLHLNLRIPTYFCDAYASWQKAGVENANKLIRRFIPKRSDISQYSSQYLAFIVRHYNSKPRKKLGWQTPLEVVKKRGYKKSA